MKFAGMEEDHQDLKFVCKQCSKRYPCGKSLGGHMRSHVIANSAEIMEDKADPQTMKRDHHQQQQQQQSRFEHGGYSSYGLRENPKKTWRAVDSTSPLPQEKACKQCGKVFQSLKALCGHMACHSEKERGGVKDDHSWSSESKKLEEVDDDSDDSDTEAEEEQMPTTTTRDRSTNLKRYKKIVVKSYSFALTNNNSIGSSSVSEIDEQEQEEVAKCLMMLSKDSGNWYGHVNSVVEFSDNNSVVLETKSSSIDMKSSRKDGTVYNKVYNRDNETPPTKRMEDRKLKSNIVHTEMIESQSSGSGYFLGENKVESDVSVNGFLAKRNCNSKVLNRVKGSYIEPRRGVDKDYDNYDDFGVASNSGKQKRTNDTSYDPELETGSYKKMKLGSPGTNTKKKYECLNCKKSFSSYQALGGHRPCHKKTNADLESSYGTGENSLEADDTYNHVNAGKIRDCFGSKKATTAKDSSEKKVKPKKGKGHECPFCHRMFKSGQALGGHKRSHFIGGAQVINSSQTPAVAKEEATDLLDLNLPAPVEDEDDEQLMAW